MSNVLILQLSRLGDLLQSTLLINSLKQQGKKVVLLGDEKNTAIANEIKLLDRFVPFEIGKLISLLKNKNYGKCYNELEKYVLFLNNENFAEIYNLNHSNINYYLISLINAKIKKGFKTGDNKFIDFIYNVLINRKTNRFNLVDIFNFFSEKPIISNRIFINKNISDNNLNFINKISKGRKNIVVHLGAGHSLREWGVANFVALSEKILKQFNVNILLTGSKNETHLGKKFFKLLNIKYRNSVLNLMGKTDIQMLKALLLHSTLLISTDTGVMHLAAACETKIVALFYASAYVFETGPYLKKSLVITPCEECYPCTEFHQNCRDIHCKKNILIDDVAAAVKYMMGESSKKTLKKYFAARNNVILYEPYFDKFGICYKNILNNITFDKIREKGFGYA